MYDVYYATLAQDSRDTTQTR